MELLTLAIAGLTAIVVAAVLARRTGIATPLVLLVVGIVFSLLPGTLLATVIGAAATVAALGLAGTWRALGQKPAPLLRNA